MRILFFTPIALASAIGRVSALVVAELVLQGHEVVVVRTEDPAEFGGPTHRFSGDVVAWNETERVAHLAAHSEIVVYQVGNHFPYHRGCLEWLPTVPGLIALHDNFLGHLFWAWSDAVGRNSALDVLSTLYGEHTAAAFFNQTDSTQFLEFASESAPLTEWIASMGSAVIVHSSWAMERIVGSCAGPVEVVPLPYDAPYLGQPESNSAGNNSQRLVALTVGHVNPNKRYESVIRALGESSFLRNHVSYRVVGPAEPTTVQELTSLAAQLGVDLVMTGAVDDRQLATEIQGADIMCCLRWPALEAASASTIEAMLYGKPTVVTDTGFYRDLPNDCVVKISPDAEIQDLRLALEKLSKFPEERVALGERAHKYASRTFRADNYARAIVRTEHRIKRSRIIGQSAEVFSSTLKRWGASGSGIIIDAVARPLDLFR